MNGKDGRRLRAWVARTDDIDTVLAGRESVFGRKLALPFDTPSFDFAMADDGALPWDGAMPCLIDRRGRPRSMTSIADLGARLRSFDLHHPERDALLSLFAELGIDHPPTVASGVGPRYRATIATPAGLRELW